MTNQEIINLCESSNFHIISISEEIDKFIKENYIDGNDSGKFYKVYKRGNDAKYGH